MGQILIKGVLFGTPDETIEEKRKREAKRKEREVVFTNEY